MSFFVFKNMGNFCKNKISKKINKFIKKQNKVLINLFSIFFIIFLIGITWYGAVTIKKNKTYPKEMDKFRVEKEEGKPETINDLMQKIKSHILINFQEEPLVVRIEDANFLKTQQDFFQDSVDGDIVVVYREKAIIYRPELDLLINVGPVYFPEQNNSGFNIEIRNGSKTLGLASSLGEILEAKNYKINKIGDASRDDYEKNIIVNVSGKNISQLENELGVRSIDILPEGEEEAKADAIIILGNN